jgi:TruD family tRNA pseudouridine synthase
LIKEHPQDFVVREILPKDKVIPGLSEKDNDLLRLANIPSQASLPRQNLPQDHHGQDDQDKGGSKRLKSENGCAVHVETSDSPEENEIEKPVVTLCPEETIDAYLAKVTRRPSGEDDSAAHDKRLPTAKELKESLRNLHQRAIQNIETFQTGMGTPAISSSNEVWIPPLPPLLSLSAEREKNNDPDAVMAMKKERGTFHKAIRLQYPFFKTESSTWNNVMSPKNLQNHEKQSRTGQEDNDRYRNNEDDHGIRVAIDNSFLDLIPYLHEPLDDLQRLLQFQNRGFEGVSESHNAQAANSKKSRGRSDKDPWWDTSCAVLKLKTGLSKEDRRKIHQLLSSKNRNFDTTTTQIEIPKDEPHKEAQDSSGNGTILALVVRWQRHVLMKSLAKRKRSEKEGRRNGRLVNKFNNLLCVLEKNQKEHLTAIQKLTQALRCRQSDIGLAGIKDLQAVTYQFITLRNMKPKRAENASWQLSKYGLRLGLFYNVDFVLNTGDLLGNRFEIMVRNLKQVKVDFSQETTCPKEVFVPCDWDHFHSMFQRVRDCGFINFYGEQRVGAPGSTKEVGVRAFDIGKAMLQKDYSKAIHLLMEGTSIRESDDVRRIRKAWKESNGDPSATLKAFHGQDIMPREKAVLRGLNRCADNPLEALRYLTHNMRMFYVHAYQSYVWNLAASKRIRLYGNEPVVGDLYFDCSDEARDSVKVVKDNNDLQGVSIVNVVLPLPGHNVQYPENEIGQFYKEQLEQDGILFEKNAVPESTAKGSYRKVIVFPKAMSIERDSKVEDCAKLSFELPKGCYATMLLREMMITTLSRSDIAL